MKTTKERAIELLKMGLEESEKKRYTSDSSELSRALSELRAYVFIALDNLED